jgi:hypothetical protein
MGDPASCCPSCARNEIPSGAVAVARLSTGLVSSSKFAATSTDSDDTAASTAQVAAWALTLAWSREEPHRTGEVAILPPFQSVRFGRGDDAIEKFVRHGIQRPGEPFRERS